MGLAAELLSLIVGLLFLSGPAQSQSVPGVNSVPPEVASAERALSRPTWATPERLRGRLQASTPVTLQVHLPLHDLAGAKAQLEAVSDPDSPRYGQYLTSEEFESKYSPTSADVATVRSYFESEGFQITSVPRNRIYVTVSAPAAQVERVFATTLGNYQVGPGDLRRAPITPSTIPAALTGHVSGVLGLSTKRAKSLASRSPADLAFSTTATPTCGNYLGQEFDTLDASYGGGFPNPTPLHACSLTPPRVRKIYGLADAVGSGNDGRGVKIAIIDPYLTPTLVSDAQAYAAQFDAKYPLHSSQITIINAPSAGDTNPFDPSWWYEQLLDVESVHAIAPGATIVFVNAATVGPEDMIAAVNLVVQDNLASIVSNSWYNDIETAPDSDIAVLDPILIQAGLKGIGLYFGSGDWGDDQCASACPSGPVQGSGAPSVIYPASSPYATAVGGTSLYPGANGHRAYETGWESGESVLSGTGSTATWVPAAPGFLYFGAGGGPSQIYPQPKYQRALVPARLAGPAPVRVIPDVAMFGDPDTGFLIGLTDPFTGVFTASGFAGTSLSAPLFAATMALAEQRAGHRIGFANPKLYKFGNVAFLDIKPTREPQSVGSVVGGWTDTEDPPNLQVQRPDGTTVPHTLHSAPGFDNVTGLGVPKGEEFLEAIGRR